MTSVPLASIKIAFVKSIARIPYTTKIRSVAMMATLTDQSVSSGNTHAESRKRSW